MLINIKNYFLKTLWILLISVIIQVVNATENLDRIVAIVGEEIITNYELQRKISKVTNSLERQNIALPSKKDLAKQVLEKMILDQIQLQMAKNFAIEVDSNSVTKAILDLAKHENLTIEQYKQKIEQEGISFTEFREQLKNEIIFSRLHHREIINDLRVSPAEIEGYLNSPAGQDNSGTEYRLSHILITSPDNSNAENLKDLDHKVAMIMEELKKGKDFKQVAASYSSGMQALEGGDLGWRKINEVPTLFVNKVIKMELNEIIGPIKSPSGLHIIKLQDKRSGNKVIYQELRARQIFMDLRQNRSEKQVVNNLMNLRKKIIEDRQDFAKLAASRSEEANTAVKGGDLGWFKQNSVLPEFWENVNKLKIDEISQPFKTDLGWHLVKLEGRRDGVRSKDTAREQALEVLREQKFNEALETWLKKIRSEAKVKIFYN